MKCLSLPVGIFLACGCSVLQAVQTLRDDLQTDPHYLMTVDEVERWLQDNDAMLWPIEAKPAPVRVSLVMNGVTIKEASGDVTYPDAIEIRQSRFISAGITGNTIVRSAVVGMRTGTSISQLWRASTPRIVEYTTVQTGKPTYYAAADQGGIEDKVNEFLDFVEVKLDAKYTANNVPPNFIDGSTFFLPGEAYFYGSEP